MTNYAKKHPYLLGISIVSIVVIIGFALGYRIQPNIRIAKDGILEMTLPLKGTVVYSDDKKLTTTSADNQTVIIPLSVKTHDIIIGREGYFPWMAQATIQPETKTILHPIFVTQNTTGQIITQKDPQYWKLRTDITNTKLPTEEKPKELNGVLLWIKDNTIYIEERRKDDGELRGEPTTVETRIVKKIITPKDTVRSLDFYKDRTDVIIFASDVGVYAMDAVENASDKVVNFFPLYKGIKPIFQKTEHSFLYVLDGENLMMVVI